MFILRCVIAWVTYFCIISYSGAQLGGIPRGLSITVRWGLELQSSEGNLSHRLHISAGMADTAEGWLGLLPFTQPFHKTSLDFHAAWTSMQRGLLMTAGLLHGRQFL